MIKEIGIKTNYLGITMQECRKKHTDINLLKTIDKLLNNMEVENE